MNIEINKFYLGIDVGAYNISFAVISEDENIEMSFNERIREGVIDSLQQGLEKLSFEFKDSQIYGVGITGNGRELVSNIIGCDLPIDEAIASVTAVMKVKPETRSLINIGNRDSFYVAMNNGIILDYISNDSCASGIGAFLEKEAAFMGLTCEEFSEKAMMSKSNLQIAVDCPCIVEEDIIRKRQMGCNKKDIARAICRVIAKRIAICLLKNVELKEPILLIGGVAGNECVRMELEELLNKKIIVPDIYNSAGAIGAALLVKRGEYGRSNFRGFGVADMKFETEIVNCVDCNNSCCIVNLKAGHKTIGSFGDRCEKYRSK